MRPRFHLPEIDATGHGVLVDDEATHLTRVLRLGRGAEIEVFDGRGAMYLARVVELDRSRVRVAVIEPVAAAPEAAIRVTLAVSVLKGEKMDDVVRDAVMVGAGAVQPVVAARSEVSLSALARAQRVERWRRIAVASAKQCGRAVVPPVAAPAAVPAWLAQPRAEPVIVLTEPSGGPARTIRDVPAAPAVTLAIGPEGGWTPEERAAFDGAGCQLVSLGGRTLRADAAPLVGIAALYQAWEGW